MAYSDENKRLCIAQALIVKVPAIKTKKEGAKIYA
jgi:hypothetical protein